MNGIAAMADVLVSYSHEDFDVVGILAKNIRSDGFEIWWDRKILPGKEFDREIERNISNSKCVVVAWSKHSVESRWVRGEASEALSQKKIVPVRFDDCRIPVEFRHIQAAHFVGWKGSRSDHEYRQLLSAIRNFAGNAETIEDRQKSRIQRGTWQLVSKSFTWSGARFILARGDIKHVIDYRNHGKYEAIYVDGIEIARGGDWLVRHPMFQFYLETDTEPSVCIVEPIFGVLSRLFTVRLSKLKVAVDHKLFFDVAR